MASTTSDRWNARRPSVSILHWNHTGVWLGIHEPDEGSTDVIVAHPKADDHCIDWFMNRPPSRIGRAARPGRRTSPGRYRRSPRSDGSGSAVGG